MRGTIILLIFISALALFNASADVSVTDADAIRMMNLSSVAVPTNSRPVENIFNFNQNALLDQELACVEINTEPEPIQTVFVVNEQASSKVDLLPTSVPTKSRPLERIFILHEGAKAYAPLTYPREMINDTIPPMIFNVTTAKVTNSSATINWDTDEFADSLIKYGIAPGAYTEQRFGELLAENHTVSLYGLAPGTGYYFIVKSTDRSGNAGEGAEFSFATDGL